MYIEYFNPNKPKKMGTINIPISQIRVQRPKAVKTVTKEQWHNIDREDSNYVRDN